MSTQYYVTVVYGFKVDSIESILKYVTKYDPDTGEPYQKGIETDRYNITISGNVFEIDEPVYSGMTFSEKWTALELYTTTDQKECVLGYRMKYMQVGVVQGQGWNPKYDKPEEAYKLPDGITTKDNAVYKFAEQYHLYPSYFVVPYCSY